MKVRMRVRVMVSVLTVSSTGQCPVGSHCRIVTTTPYEVYTDEDVRVSARDSKDAEIQSSFVEP